MASLSNKVDVLVVGAGPVGLLTALELARAGIEVEIIDLAWRSTSQSYACGIHPATLGLLAARDLHTEALASGTPIPTVAFYEGPQRRAELRLADFDGAFPFLLVLPQDRLEEILEDQLKALGLRVHWGHRLDDLTQDVNSVQASVEKLTVTSVGYPFARSEEMVDSVLEVRARYLVAADGCCSHVRQMLGIGTESVGTPATYEVFEFEPATPSEPEVRVAIGPGTTDVLWPQGGSLARWSLELDSEPVEHPAKERSSIVVLNDEVSASDRERLLRRLATRAPWYNAGIREIDWLTFAGFDRMRASRFGIGRCWLVGDAGHQTSPVGMQSMNVGLREAGDLARRLVSLLREAGSPDLLAAYESERTAEWRSLLGGTLTPRPGASIDPWVKAHARRLLPCLPGSGTDLERLAGQLGLVRA